jgi:hypothetical protein
VTGPRELVHENEKKKPYSPEEDKILSQDGLSLEDLSRRLGRTINSVRNRRYLLKPKI